MKTILTVIFITCCGIIVFGFQANVVEKEIVRGKSTMNAMVLTVGHNPSTVRKSFIKYFKDNLDIKLRHTGKNEMEVKDITIPMVIDKRGDFQAIAFLENDTVKLGAGFSVGYENYLTSLDDLAEMEALKEFLIKYAVYHDVQYFSEVLEDNQKRLKDLSNTMKRNGSELRMLTRRIEKIEKTISKSNDPNKRFDLLNENIVNKARVQAMNDILVNLVTEMTKIGNVVESTKGSLSKLEVSTTSLSN